MKKLPDLHKQAFRFKNTKRLQHDGGRAWSRDPQLHEARGKANGRLFTVEGEDEADVLPKQKESTLSAKL